MKPQSPSPNGKQKRAGKARPTCPQCNRYADRERDNKGRFYVACYGCSYDSRYGFLPPPSLLQATGHIAGRGK